MNILKANSHRSRRFQLVFKAYNYGKKRLQHKCFTVNIAKFFRTALVATYVVWY